jgi:hypothetical protein
MNAAERQSWIVAYLEAKGEEYEKMGHSVRPEVNILDADFVEAYAVATGAKCRVQFFGAPKCPMLGRDLGALFAAKRLDRVATGLSPGDASMGFPKWVYSYRLKRARW